MKVKALQEKESQAAMENMQKKSFVGRFQQVEDNIEEKLESAREINEIIMKRSQEASLVITNLPPQMQKQSP